MYTNYLKWIFQIHGRLEIRHIKIPTKKITNDNCTLIFLTFLLLLNIDYRQIISKLYYFFYMRVIGLRATSPACSMRRYTHRPKATWYNKLLHGLLHMRLRSRETTGSASFFGRNVVSRVLLPVELKETSLSLWASLRSSLNCEYVP